jgi:hypothetical protein
VAEWRRDGPWIEIETVPGCGQSMLRFRWRQVLDALEPHLSDE